MHRYQRVWSNRPAGSAMLEFIVKGTLPAIEVLCVNKNEKVETFFKGYHCGILKNNMAETPSTHPPIEVHHSELNKLLPPDQLRKVGEEMERSTMTISGVNVPETRRQLAVAAAFNCLKIFQPHQIPQLFKMGITAIKFGDELVQLRTPDPRNPEAYLVV